MPPHQVRSRSGARFVAALVVGIAVFATVAPAAAADPDAFAPSPAIDAALRYPMTMPVSGLVESLVGGGCPSRRAHAGIDVSSPFGSPTPVHAAYAGYAREVATGNGYGLAVEITHFSGDGARYLTRYAHLSEALVPPEGRWVAQDEVVGNTGATGNAQIVHLHFELRDGDDAVLDLNPAFAPCRREVTAGEPMTVDVPGLVSPAALAVEALEPNNWAMTGVNPEATALVVDECRYWDRATDSGSPRCDAGRGGVLRTDAPGGRATH